MPFSYAPLMGQPHILHTLASPLKVLIIWGHILFKDKSPYLLGDQTPTCFHTIVLKTNERQFQYLRPEVLALFSFQIVNSDLTLRPKWPGSPVLKFFNKMGQGREIKMVHIQI
jgi:hypothetical protein